MSTRYLLLKCSDAGSCDPIDSFSASCMDEAKDALRWMRAHHPEREDLRLDSGQFFEILEEERLPPEEWRALMERLDRKRATRRGTSGLQGLSRSD